MVLTVDRLTLLVPARLAEWTWAGRQGTNTDMMRAFMSFKLQPLEWFNGENGINSINATKLGPHMAPAFTHPLDVYATTQGIKRRQQAAQVAPKVGGALPGGAAPHQHAGGPYEHMRMSKLDSQRARAACPASHFHSKAYYA